MRRLFFLAILLVFVVGCEVLPSSQPSATTNFEIPPGEKHTVAVHLDSGESVEGSFSVSGAEDYLDFYITGPNGELVFGVVRAVGGQGFSVAARTTGTYTMTFDNAFSFGSSRQVSLTYSKG